MSDVPLRIGVVLPQNDIDPTDPELVARFAASVEAAGADHLLAFDHVLGADTGERPDWSGPYDHTSSFLEPMTLFGYLAARTTLELVTDVMILPQRQTALVAKQAATIDVLTKGRLRLGVGIGWNEVEYHGLGMKFSNRARRIEEQISLLRRLWTESSVTVTGEFDSIDRAGLSPLPVQRPIPIWIGCGDARSALERVGRLADGWLPRPLLGRGERLAAAWSIVQDSARAAGRDPGAVGLEVQLAADSSRLDRIVNAAERWQALGATHIALNSMEQGLTWPEGHLEACVITLEKLRSHGFA